jgi:RNA polymerase sigma factor (TIGR02999 family)
LFRKNNVKEVTRILNAIEGGDAEAINALLPVVYEELRTLAAQKLAHERPGHTLQATALVHEAYLRLVGSEGQDWRCRTYFFGAAAESMRRILIDKAREKQRLKRGGDRARMELMEGDLSTEDDPDDLIALDDALKELAEKDPTKAELVKLRYFAGLTIEQAAELLNISSATAKRYWTYARAWLYGQIQARD